MTRLGRFLEFWRWVPFGDWSPLGDGWEVRHRPGAGTTVRGKVARAKVPAILEFFGRDLKLGGPARVRGSVAPGRATRLTFSGGNRSVPFWHEKWVGLRR